MPKPLEELVFAIRAQSQAEAYNDPVHKRVYSVDASIYEIEPAAIAIPRTGEDLSVILALAKEAEVPLIPRGAATGIAGGCLGSGLIVDLSKHLHKILAIDEENGFAVCQPGVVQDRLNEALAPRGYRLGPDTSTGDRATLGGMLANNAAGSRSLRFGKMVDHVQAVSLLLASGETLRFSSIDLEQWKQKSRLPTKEGSIYRQAYRLRQDLGEEIRRRFPPLPRRASGYNLDALLSPSGVNLSQLVVGSEGTLGIATEIKVNICRQPTHAALCVIAFSSMQEGMEAVLPLLAHDLLSLEMIDRHIIQAGRLSPSLRGKWDWLPGDPAVVLVAECDGASLRETTDKLQKIARALRLYHPRAETRLLLSPDQIRHVWQARKAGLGLLLSKRTYSRAIAFIEDISVPPTRLAPFMDQFQRCLQKYGKEAGIYGHVGPGCLHVRPYIDLRNREELFIMKEMMEEVSDLLLAYQGALSGEHGDGLVRSWLNRKMFGDVIYQAFVDWKRAFDPENRMNPGKIVEGQDLLENLRMNPQTNLSTIETFQDFSREGGLALAADLCNGNGLCRKKEGTMCPSFQATEDEYDTTRARAQALRATLQGKLPLNDFADPALYDVLDLCLQCKGCKQECPSLVDMAKMKAEFLYRYQEKWGYSLRSRLFGHIGALNRWGSPFASWINGLSESNLTKWLLNRLGIASERPLPPLASVRFSRWAQKVEQTQKKREVVLFNDTYTEFNHPEIGQAALRVLNAFGCRVIIPPWTCCGRPLISKGMLPAAYKMARQTIERLYPYVERGLPLIGLEPSCLLTLKDDYRDLLALLWPEGKEKIEKTISVSYTFAEFIQRLIQEESLPPFAKNERNFLLHGHCHQKALVGLEPTLAALRAFSEGEVKTIDSGCCGLAGSFGYEKEHYALSLKIGELRLFPAVRAAEASALIIADGVSCRAQIAHGAQKPSVHLAQALDAILFPNI